MRVLLNSTNIAEVRYHPSAALMEISFQSGHIYHYSNIPKHVFQELIQARSAGRYYNMHIRGKYSSMRWI